MVAASEPGVQSGASDPAGTDSSGGEDWLGEFYLHAFVALICADTEVERRELVWIKRYFCQRGRARFYARLEALIGEGAPADEQALARLAAVADERMTTADKRRFVFNLAQMCKSKGAISATEYGSILRLAESIGVDDTAADSIINSVFSINDTFMAILGMLAIGVILYTTKVVIVPLVIALFIAMIVGKVESTICRVLRIKRWRWATKIAATVVIVSGIFSLVMAAAVAGKELSKRRDFYEAKITESLQQVRETANRYNITWLDRSGVIEQLKKLPIGEAASGLAGSLITILGNFVLVMIFTGFLVFTTSGFSGGLLQEMNDKISGYISVKTVSSLITGVAVYGLSAAFGVDFALFWAVIAFLLNFIPSVGSIVASVPPILLSMIQLSSWSSVAMFSIFLVVVHLLIGQVLEPKMMGSRLAVKPAAILLGLIFWGFLWGLPGMFLAAPLMALLRILASYFNFSRSFERLLAAD